MQKHGVKKLNRDRFFEKGTMEPLCHRLQNKPIIL